MFSNLLYVYSTSAELSISSKAIIAKTPKASISIFTCCICMTWIVYAFVPIYNEKFTM